MLGTIERTGLADYLRSFENKGSIVVCESKRFIYLKPAKTAGTSILRHCLQKEIPDLILFKDQPEEFSIWLENLTDEALRDYFIFTVVRNPWDRLVSLAHYFKIPVRDFARNLDKYLADKKIRNHALPQHLYSHLNGCRFVDFICRFEVIQADFNLVCDELRLKRIPLPYSNKTIHRHYSKYFDDDLARLTADLYAKDIEYYGYAFEEKPSFLSLLGKTTRFHTLKYRLKAYLAEQKWLYTFLKSLQQAKKKVNQI